MNRITYYLPSLIVKRLLPVLLLILVVACKEGKKQEKPVNLDSLQNVLTSLTDSLNASWSNMIASDDQKLRHIQTLVQLLEKLPHTNTYVLDSVRILTTSMPDKRYHTIEEITLEKVDAYDAATDSLMNLVRKAYESADKKKCESCEALMNRISEIDGEVVTYRIHYDQQTQAYNTFVQQNQKNMAKANPKYQKLHPKPVFQNLQ
jgi:hypothetical protein